MANLHKCLGAQQVDLLGEFFLLPVLLPEGNSAPKRLAHSLALHLFSAHKDKKPGPSSPSLTSRLLGHSFPSIQCTFGNTNCA